MAKHVTTTIDLSTEMVTHVFECNMYEEASSDDQIWIKEIYKNEYANIWHESTASFSASAISFGPIISLIRYMMATFRTHDESERAAIAELFEELCMVDEMLSRLPREAIAKLIIYGSRRYSVSQNFNATAEVYESTAQLIRDCPVLSELFNQMFTKFDW